MFDIKDNYLHHINFTIFIILFLVDNYAATEPFLLEVALEVYVSPTYRLYKLPIAIVVSKSRLRYIQSGMPHHCFCI